MNRLFALVLLTACTTAAASAQAPRHTKGKLVDRRDQAEGWYVPVHGQVTVDGKKAESFEMILYKDNVELGKLEGKNGRFELELDIDQFYTLRITKEGRQEKMLYFDTKLPPDLVKYPDYECFVNLQAPLADGTDPFYTDFPLSESSDTMKPWAGSTTASITSRTSRPGSQGSPAPRSSNAHLPSGLTKTTEQGRGTARRARKPALIFPGSADQCWS